MEPIRQCRICEKELSLTNVFFREAGRRKHLLRFECRECEAKAQQGYYLKHRDTILTKRCLNYYIRIKEQMFAALGNSCRRCGFADKRALQIDHVNGGGTKSKGDRIGSPKYLRKILANPHDFQILCANCNTIKRIENGEVRKWRPLNA